MNRSIFKSWTHYLLGFSFTLFVFTGCNSSNDQNTQAEDIGEMNAREEVPQTEEIREEYTEDTQDEFQNQDTAVYDSTQNQTNQQATSTETTGNTNQQMEPIEGGVTTVRVSYNQWDANSDGILENNEFYDGFYKVWDENGDNSISADEFDRGTNDFFANYDYNESGEFDEWDTNMDSGLTTTEFQNRMNKILGTQDENKTAERLMTVWNQDNDKNIERIDLGNVTVMLDKDSN